MDNIITESTITCPVCNEKHKEEMPMDSCMFFWECPSCHHIIKAKKGDCCVFCSYGDVPCPPMQQGNSCEC